VGRMLLLLLGLMYGCLLNCHRLWLLLLLL
jgi:hypothetical protein